MLSVKLRKDFAGFRLDAEWEIGNELAVLFGYSGSGKSLTLQMLAGLMRPDAGSVRSAGEVYFDAASGVDVPARRRPFGYVFQDLALFPHMTVKENILYGGVGLDRTERNDRARASISSFRLHGLEERLPCEISGGQKQRVAFARALVRRPKLLLLDEPFSALDKPIRIEMRNLLRDIRSVFSIPVILVTHDLAEASSLADRLIVYSGGRVIQTGSVEEVFARAASPEVEALLRPESAAPWSTRIELTAGSIAPLPVATKVS